MHIYTFTLAKCVSFFWGVDYTRLLTFQTVSNFLRDFDWLAYRNTRYLC